ncbi:glutathione S-transferase family protein [Massilia endophytica]|uniref:glutathione S-transferase family protein n=1 Tax=Massilia endophytica TaxID=2899220 RepID=UPI001E619398|nr:glutathione S-transferase family protein [Massilia endophytica]UGQ45362.1 glutathione S-transferase family protein [Massilia endophytica]
MYTLYYSAGAASLALHAALFEIGAPYELVEVDLSKKRDASYLKLNPQGVVPTLVVDGEVLRESAALMLLLTERHPEAGLAPQPGSPLRGRFLQDVVWMANTFGSAYRLWFYPADLDATEENCQGRDALRRRIESSFAELDERLSANGPYLLGEQFSAADLMLTMYMRWSRKMPRPATEWPALNKLADLVCARPSWKHVNATEGLSGWR